MKMATASTMITTINEYDSFIRPYEAVIREITLRLEVLNTDFKGRSPIHNIQSRVKTPESICAKLERRGHEISLDAARDYLTDIAGERVICYYTRDVYTVVEALHGMSDLDFPRESDYIKSPKPSGYRSYHMITVVPVHGSGGVEYYPAEIQLRTLCMDAWAGMEHQIRYKQPCKPDAVTSELRRYAELMNGMEASMALLYDRLHPEDK